MEDFHTFHIDKRSGECFDICVLDNQRLVS